MTDHWDDAQIEKAARIFVRAEKNKSTSMKVLEEALHWILIILIFLGNIVIDVFLVFSSGIVSELYLYLLAAVLGIGFGILVEVPLSDIQKLDHHKHFLSRIMLPVLALLNVYLLIGVSSTVEYLSSLDLNFNALYVGVLYGVCFVVPHLVNTALKKK